MSANIQIFRCTGGCIGRRQGVQMIHKSGKAENDLDLRDARWILSTKKNYPSHIDSSVPVKAFQSYVFLFYRFREGSGIKGLREMKQ